MAEVEGRAIVLDVVDEDVSVHGAGEPIARLRCPVIAFRAVHGLVHGERAGRRSVEYDAEDVLEARRTAERRSRRATTVAIAPALIIGLSGQPRVRSRG